MHAKEGEPAGIKGELMFARPNKVKLVLRAGEQSMLVLCDGNQLYQQDSPTSFTKAKPARDATVLGDTLAIVPVIGLTKLGVLLSPAKEGNGEMFTKLAPGPTGMDRFQDSFTIDTLSMTMRSDFDVVTHLMTRSEMEVNGRRGKSTMITKFDSIKTGVTFPKDTFTFRPAAGTKVVAAE